jgi:hypothetical protein
VAQPSRALPEHGGGPDPAHERALELARRIEELEALDDSAFGGFTSWDWLACTLIALVLPVAAFLWFGP